MVHRGGGAGFQGVEEKEYCSLRRGMCERETSQGEQEQVWRLSVLLGRGWRSDSGESGSKTSWGRAEAVAAESFGRRWLWPGLMAHAHRKARKTVAHG